MNPLPTSYLRQLAEAVGFDLVGFARAEPIPPESLSRWLEAGYAADMDWMGERAAERLDVSQLLPGAKTVVVFANNYYRDDAETEDSPIARYARGRDYHSTLRDRMKAFRKALKDVVPRGAAPTASVDSGPMMEKVWAARAGLGYVGKNGCFITERFGSWVLLATRHPRRGGGRVRGRARRGPVWLLPQVPDVLSHGRAGGQWPSGCARVPLVPDDREHASARCPSPSAWR